MNENSKCFVIAVHAGKPRTGETSTTIPCGSRVESLTTRKGLPLTGDAEGEEIVCSHMKV